MFFRKNAKSKSVQAGTNGENLQQNQFVKPDFAFPNGSHVFGITEGPLGHVMVGAGNPSTGEGTVLIRESSGLWTQVELPDETAWLSQFVKLSDGTWIASGMSLLGRAAIVRSDIHARNWKSIDMDLHPYSQINALVQLPNGELLAATGEMITQGKTRPILLRSKDQGETWEKQEVKLSITQFHTLYLDGSLIYGGPSGDHTPKLYTSEDFGVTWKESSNLPSYKTYKTVAFQPIQVNGKKKILCVMWGYKIDIADRVVRLYIADDLNSTWEELPPVLDSHFIFSFHVSKNSDFYAGSEKGMFLRSTDAGKTWEKLAQFPTNIGAYAIYQRDEKIWLGKDFVEPGHASLWTLKS